MYLLVDFHTFGHRDHSAAQSCLFAICSYGLTFNQEKNYNQFTRTVFLACEKWLSTLLIKELFVLVGVQVDCVKEMHGRRLANSLDNYAYTPAGQAGSLLDCDICPHRKSYCLPEEGRWGWGSRDAAVHGADSLCPQRISGHGAFSKGLLNSSEIYIPVC